MTEKLTLVAIFAHPDDEAFGTGGTLTKYAHEGVDVHLVTATLGEAGEVASLLLLRPEEEKGGGNADGLVGGQERSGGSASTRYDLQRSTVGELGKPQPAVLPGDLDAERPQVPEPLDQRSFYKGYRERLESKLRHKITQIQRTERLLETLPQEQRPAFVALLDEARNHRREIQSELDDLYNLMKQYNTTTE